MKVSAMFEEERKPMIPEGDLKTYVTGFVLSVVLTLGSYFLVTSIGVDWPRQVLIGIVLTLALIQLLVQLVFFLHLLHESKPRWNLMFLLAFFSTVFLVVVASIWIMQHLNHNMMPADIMKYVQDQQGGF